MPVLSALFNSLLDKMGNSNNSKPLTDKDAKLNTQSRDKKNSANKVPPEKINSAPASLPTQTHTRVQAFDDDDSDYDPGETELFRKTAVHPVAGITSDKDKEKDTETNSPETPKKKDPSAEWLKNESNKLKSQGLTRKTKKSSTIYTQPRAANNANDGMMVLCDF